MFEGKKAMNTNNTKWTIN